MTFTLAATNEEDDQALLNSTLGSPHNLAEDLVSMMKQRLDRNPTMSKEIRNKLISTLYNEVGLDPSIFYVEAYAAQDIWVDVFCASITNQDISSSLNESFYILFLFSKSGSGLYLSLNQDWRYYIRKYDRLKAKEEMKETASLLQAKLPIPYNLQSLSINLEGQERGVFAKRFEEGHICGTFYDAKHFPTSEKIVADLLSLINVYKGINQVNIRNNEESNEYLQLEEDGLFIEDADSEESFQEEVQKQASGTELSKEKEDRKIPRRLPVLTVEGKESFPRRFNVSAEALIEARYKCVIDESHESFTSKSTLQPYMEAHHIVPMSKQEQFEYELDQAANVVALCPNCHRLVHLGVDIEREELLSLLFFQRQDRLKKIGIEINFSQIKLMYGFG